MNWANTVMNPEQLDEVYEKEYLRRCEFSGRYPSRLSSCNWDPDRPADRQRYFDMTHRAAIQRATAKAQAEASFKAGYEEGRKGCPALEVQGQIYLEGKEAGIREVVEWVQGFPCHTLSGMHYRVPVGALQAKLKEWGIKEGK